MLDIRLIRENAAEVKRRLALRGRGDESVVDQLLALDEERRGAILEVETLKAARNKASKEIGLRKAKKEAAEDLLAEMKTVSDQITLLDHALVRIEEQQQQILLLVPNLPLDHVPVGTDAAANRTERTWGTPASFPFSPRPHWEIGKLRGLLDFDQATKISGSGFIVFRGLGARLERVLISYLLDLHTREDNYVEIAPPYLVRRECMVGTGQLPKFADDMYHLAEGDMFLIPTAEVPVTNLHREEILAEAQLPLRYAAYTPCFRREAGSAGRDTRGMIRVHQFDKVELVQIVKPEDSAAALEGLVSSVEKVLQRLQLHYRVLSLCTGDLGFGAAQCYDLEVWAPGLGTWLEVSSCSSFVDFQARRMNLRYKNSEGKNVFCHTLNGSGTALARLVIALLETHQQPDGSVLLPEPLRAAMGVDVI
jgi:seryl-tRNA synthetase